MRVELVQYLTVADVTDLHDQVLRATGGMPGILSPAELDAAVMGPRAAYDGFPLLSSLVDIAAGYGYYITKLHPFADGNKRTALLSMAAFLDRHGLPMTITREWVEIMVAVAAETKFSRERLAALLAESAGGWGELES